MKNNLILTISCVITIWFISTQSTSAQSVDCPVDRVCITHAQAIKALQDGDKVTAQAAEIVVKDQAIDDLKKEVSRMQVELAKATGEKTGAEQMVVRLTAITDILLKHVKPKKIGLINF